MPATARPAGVHRAPRPRRPRARVTDREPRLPSAFTLAGIASEFCGASLYRSPSGPALRAQCRPLAPVSWTPDQSLSSRARASIDSSEHWVRIFRRKPHCTRWSRTSGMHRMHPCRRASGLRTNRCMTHLGCCRTARTSKHRSTRNRSGNRRFARSSGRRCTSCRPEVPCRTESSTCHRCRCRPKTT
jgi:hypothetical protein